MAFNPVKEVATARDAATALESQLCVIMYVSKDGKLGTASYGATKRLCTHAMSLAEHLRKAAETWGDQ